MEQNFESSFNDIDYNSTADFEFLFRHDDIYITNDLFDKMLSPESVDWEKIEHQNWTYFVTEHGAFSYSFEMIGIQMTFTKDFDFEVAKKIADEVLPKVKRYNDSVELIEITGDTPMML